MRASVHSSSGRPLSRRLIGALPDRGFALRGADPIPSQSLPRTSARSLLLSSDLRHERKLRVARERTREGSTPVWATPARRVAEWLPSRREAGGPACLREALLRVAAERGNAEGDGRYGVIGGRVAERRQARAYGP